MTDFKSWSLEKLKAAADGTSPSIVETSANYFQIGTTMMTSSQDDFMATVNSLQSAWQGKAAQSAISSAQQSYAQMELARSTSDSSRGTSTSYARSVDQQKAQAASVENVDTSMGHALKSGWWGGAAGVAYQMYQQQQKYNAHRDQAAEIVQTMNDSGYDQATTMQSYSWPAAQSTTGGPPQKNLPPPPAMAGPARKDDYGRYLPGSGGGTGSYTPVVLGPGRSQTPTISTGGGKKNNGTELTGGGKGTKNNGGENGTGTQGTGTNGGTNGTGTTGGPGNGTSGSVDPQGNLITGNGGANGGGIAGEHPGGTGLGGGSGSGGGAGALGGAAGVLGGAGALGGIAGRGGLGAGGGLRGGAGSGLGEEGGGRGGLRGSGSGSGLGEEGGGRGGLRGSGSGSGLGEEGGARTGLRGNGSALGEEGGLRGSARGTAAGEDLARGMRPGGFAGEPVAEAGRGGYPMMPGGRRGSGSDDEEAPVPDYLVETDDVWGDGSSAAPAVIGE